MLKRMLSLAVALWVFCGCLPGGWAQNEPAALPPMETSPQASSQPDHAAGLNGAVYQADYLIGVGDALNLEDSEMGSLVKDSKVLSDGSIRLPLVGKVILAGLSIQGAKQLLTEKYAHYFVNPKLTLQVMNQRPVRVYVTGAVAKPGIYLSGKNTQPESTRHVELGAYDLLFWFYRLYLTDALLLAGGLNYNANVSDIRIKRGGPQPVTIHVNLMDLISGDASQDISLRDQDVIEVQALDDTELVMDEQWEKLAASNIGLGSFRVKIMGAVSKPGAYDVQARDTVLSAVTKAGGFSELADQGKVYILRTTLSGQVVKRELNLSDKKLLSKKPFEEWTMLLPNDVVYVEESNARKAALAGENLVQKSSTAALFPFFSNLLRPKE